MKYGRIANKQLRLDLNPMFLTFYAQRGEPALGSVARKPPGSLVCLAGNAKTFLQLCMLETQA